VAIDPGLKMVLSGDLLRVQSTPAAGERDEGPEREGETCVREGEREEERQRERREDGLGSGLMQGDGKADGHTDGQTGRWDARHREERDWNEEEGSGGARLYLPSEKHQAMTN